MNGAIEIGLLLPTRGTLAKRAIESAVETLARSNEQYLRANPDTPKLFQSGVKYQRERKLFGAAERWQTIPEILKAKSGDCEDLAAWLIAELRTLGYDARPHIIPAGKTPGRWHIQVAVIINKRKLVLDPSAKLGM